MLAARSPRFGWTRVFRQCTHERFTIEHINTHRAKCATRFFRLFIEGGDSAFGIGFHDTETMPLFDGDHGRAQRGICATLLMQGDHRAIIHTINMVARQDEYIVTARFYDGAEILIDRVSRALIPVGLLATSVGLEQVHTALA